VRGCDRGAEHSGEGLDVLGDRTEAQVLLRVAEPDGLPLPALDELAGLLPGGALVLHVAPEGSEAVAAALQGKVA